jgi:hypothetical protein
MQQYGGYGVQGGGYGGSYGAYGEPQGEDAQKEDGAGFGGIRGQGASQGRIDRSYRPY